MSLDCFVCVVFFLETTFCRNGSLKHTGCKIRVAEQDCGSSEMAVASHPLLSGVLDGSIQRDELGFDTLSSMSRSPESSPLTENDHGTSSLAVPPHKLPSGLPDDTLKRSDVGFDSLSSLHGSPKASKLTENTDIAWHDGTKSPEYFDCGPEPVNVSDVIPKEPTCIFVQKEEPCGDVQPSEPKPTQTSHPEVTELADERDSEDGNTAVPIRGFQSGEAAVRRERDDDVAVLSDTEGADRLQKELCCADVPSVPRRDEKDGEEVGNVVILEPTINKEVPASICRESSSPRLYEEYVSKADEPSENKSAHSGRVTECSVVEPSQQSVTCEQWQSHVASRTGVAARSWRKMAMQQPRYQLTCSSCLELFSSRYELIRHVFVHFDDIEPPLHVCVMCGEEFGTDKEVAEHHKNSGAQCYAFVSVVKIHLRSPDTVWFCSTCEQTFETEHRLAIHKAKRHLRTVVSACTEMPVSAAKLDDLPQVRAENCHVCKRKGGRSPGLPQQEAFHRNYKRKLGRPSVHLQEAPHSNYERKPGQSLTTSEITVREPLNIKFHPVDVRSETMPRGRIGKKTQITSAEPPGRKRGRSHGYRNGEPLDGNPDGRKLQTLESDASTLLEITRGDSLNRTLEVASGESFNIKPEMPSGEPVHRIDETTLKEQLNRTADIAHGDTHDRRRETACGETFDRGKETAHGEILGRIPETAHRGISDETSESARGKNLARIPEVTPGEPLDRLSTVAQTPESLQNKSGIMPGEPFNSKIGMTPDHLIDSKPKKRRGRPPGSKNKNPSKPRARKPKTVSGGLPNGTPEVTVGKPLQVIRPGGSMDSLLEMTPGVPVEMMDEMRSGPPSGRRYGECLYDLVPGELPDRLHEMTPGEHLYGLHEIGQRDQLYSLHEITPGVPPDVTPRESLDKLHDATQGEPMYRLHEMTTVESIHRLHEMSPVEILYRNHESTPGTPLDTVPKVATAEPISSLHEMAPMDIHYRNDEINNRESTPVSPLNAIPKIPSVEPFNGLSEMPPPEPVCGLSEMTPAGILHRPSEMPPREPLRKLTEMAPVEPFRRPSEMTPSETLYREYKMASGETPRRPSEMASAEPLRRLSVMPPEESLLRLYEMEPRDPLHTLFEMATGDPFHTLFEMEPEDPFWSSSKMSPGEPYNRLSEMAPEQPLNNQSETAKGNFVNGVPKKKRGRPPGSKNRFPAKPRCKKSKTEPGEALCTKPKATSGESRDTVSPGAPSYTIPEILLGESGEKKSNKNAGEAEKWPCHFCHQLFCSLSGLKRHLVRHTGERNYVCDLCGESFARSDNLRVHRYTHTGGLPYKCDVCGRAFSWACHLRDHKRKCQSS